MFQHTAARRRLVKINSLSPFSLISFNTQPPEGGWYFDIKHDGEIQWFQHTAARRRLAARNASSLDNGWFQHTAARRRLEECLTFLFVSACFNTQPPEGGWIYLGALQPLPCCFNTQPPEGGWMLTKLMTADKQGFQHTAARRRLA